MLNEAQWQAFASVAGIAGFGGIEDRLARVDALDEAVAAFAKDQVAELLMVELQAAGVPAGHVASSLELGVDPHLSERGFWKPMERPHVGELLHPAAPYRVGDAPFDIRRVAPTLGQHNREVLSELLDLTDADIDELEERGIIGDRPRLP